MEQVFARIFGGGSPKDKSAIAQMLASTAGAFVEVMADIGEAERNKMMQAALFLASAAVRLAPDSDTLRELVSDDTPIAPTARGFAQALLWEAAMGAGPELIKRMLDAIRARPWSETSDDAKLAQENFVFALFLFAEDPVWDQIDEQLRGALAVVLSPTQHDEQTYEQIAEEIRQQIKSHENEYHKKIGELDPNERYVLLGKLIRRGPQQ
jgi:hypothetical protein